VRKKARIEKRKRERKGEIKEGTVNIGINIGDQRRMGKDNEWIHFHGTFTIAQREGI